MRAPRRSLSVEHPDGRIRQRHDIPAHLITPNYTAFPRTRTLSLTTLNRSSPESPEWTHPVLIRQLLRKLAGQTTREDRSEDELLVMRRNVSGTVWP